VVRQASPPRRLQGKVVALCAALVVLGGVLTVVGIRAYSTRVTVLALARDVPQGSPLTSADLTTAQITNDPNLAPVPASQQTSVLGMIAATRLSEGDLLTRADLTRGNGFTPGQALVPLASKEGQLPAQGLSPGERVLIVPTAANASGQTQGQPQATGGAGSAPPVAAPLPAAVVDVGALNPSSGVTVVDVRVPQASAVAIAQLAASGGFELIALPAGNSRRRRDHCAAVR
jgi:SAF domain.